MRLLLKNLVFTLAVPGTVGVYVPLLMVGQNAPAGGWLRALSFVVLAAGAAVYAWCVWDFAAFGRGTPAPIDAPRHLVDRGLYRWVRNPMYVGVLTVILAWALLFRAALLMLYALAVAVCFHLFIVLYEEPHLQRVFGGEYDAYRARAGRWLPKLPRH